jgi:cadmium resistance transport/sequestration family protein
MNWLLTALGAGVAAFVATNIDDIFLLTLFFSQVNTTFRKRHIVLGQYLGFAALVAVSTLGFLGTLIVPPAVIGLLGIVPILMGLHKLVQRTSAHAVGDVPLKQDVATPQRHTILDTVLSPHTYGVAAVTVANGSDNISIYLPLFASGDAGYMGIIILVFFVLVGVWCFVGYKLGKHPTVARVLDRYGHILVPFVLIGLGIFILLESGAIVALATFL